MQQGYGAARPTDPRRPALTIIILFYDETAFIDMAVRSVQAQGAHIGFLEADDYDVSEGLAAHLA